MKQSLFEIVSNIQIAENVFKMVLSGDTEAVKKPGQFVNIKIEEDGLFLRRPISVCDCENAGGNGNEKEKGTITIIYKVVGKGTEKMSRMKSGTLDILSGLGNGYDTSLSGEKPLLIGGGVGVPPLYMLAKKLISEGKKVSVILGFNKKSEIFFFFFFKRLGASVKTVTVDGSYGLRGYVTDAMPKDAEGKDGYTYFYTCGPEPMLKAVYKASKTAGQFSFEERMGCGFGACMGCSCRTITGSKRICKEGPVMAKEEILWED